MDPISPASLNMLLGMLAKWTLPGDAPSDDGMGFADPSAPSSGHLAPAGGRDAAAPSVLDADGLPSATSDDAATRFAPSVPVSQSLMGLRSPHLDTASPSAGATSPDRYDAQPSAQPDGLAGGIDDGQGPGLRAGRDVTPAGSGPASSLTGPRGAGAAAAVGNDGAATLGPERDARPPTPVAATPADSNGGAASRPATSSMAMATPASALATDPGADADASRSAAMEAMDPEAAAPSPSIPRGAPDAADRRADAPTLPPMAEEAPGAAPREPVPGGTAPTLASAAQPLSVPDTPPDGVRPHAEAKAGTDAVRKGDHLPWSSRQDAIAEHRPATADMPVLRRDDVSDVDGWALPMLSPSVPADGQVERAGIIASFILNAAMIPGWPPPRPFDMPEAESLMDHLTSGRGGMPDEEALAALLKERGCEEGLLARMRARLSKSRRLRLLLAMTALWTTIEALIEAVEQELLRVSGKVDDTDAELERNDTRRALTA